MCIPHVELEDSYPEDLIKLGLTEEVLLSSISKVKAGNATAWNLHGRIPTIGFYRSLHRYLQRLNATKTTIGKLYFGIDSNLKEKESRPDNAYRFVERIISSSRNSEERMLYNTYPIKSMISQAKKCIDELETLNAGCVELKTKLKKTKTQLKSTRHALQDVTNSNTALVQEVKNAKEIINQLKQKNVSLEEECVNYEVEMLAPETDSDDTDDPKASETEPTLQDLIGNSRKYSPSIRALYYNLLAEQMPASKIPDIIKHVLKCFNRSENIDSLQLPKKSCASYMRKDELKTVCDAHKASIISESSELYLNTDGTTKNQKKLGGVVASGMVLCVNELEDGSAVSAVEDISREFEKLRKAANLLGLPNPNSINWTLVVSSTSDSAATQKRINKLIEECRQNDEEKFGAATADTIDLVETFCSMHLGVNLRKAFLNGIANVDEEAERRYHRVDTLVHEFCKLFGKTGVPEYCLGVLSFPVFLEIKVSSSSGLPTIYYSDCLKVRLHRQVGSRYFVCAANACKILFLRRAAIEYLKYTGKDAGNKLERDVYLKLQDPIELFHLMADSLMYYHIYGDLLMMSKSKELGLSVYSMNKHYLELKLYLSELTKDPEVALNPNYHVFPSEKRIYVTDSKVNHRSKSLVVYQNLFEEVKTENSCLLSLLVKGALATKNKLCSYAADQLPGGVYWDPDKDVKDILCQLQPSNDVCEAILGLNDYLTTAIPNLHQMSRSNLVQLKKNKTLKWLSELPSNRQEEVIDLAVKQRQEVEKTYSKEEAARCEARKQAMVKNFARREALKKKLYEDKTKLSQLHIITTAHELRDELLKVDKKNASATKKRTCKIEILRTQVQIRKKVLGQTLPIKFTSNRKQRPLCDITNELCDFITKMPIPENLSFFFEQPASLIGRRIKHKFQDEQDIQNDTWYEGTIIDYSVSDKTHCVEYNGEEELCYFDLLIDFLAGDIVLID